jgi:hypothetical protein
MVGMICFKWAWNSSFILWLTMALGAVLLTQATAAEPTQPPGLTPLVAQAPLPVQPLVTRRALAQFLVTRFELPTYWPSLFPLFVDVPLSDKDYKAIDTVFRYHLLFPDNDGSFEPDKPATQLDAWLSIGKVLFPSKKLSPAIVKTTLADVAGNQQLAPYQTTRVALLVMAGILSKERGDIPLKPQEPITTVWLDEMLKTLESSRILLAEQAKKTIYSELSEDGADVPKQHKIPPGSYLVITPSEAIIGKELIQNQSLYFQLKEPLSLAVASPTSEGQSTGVVIPAGSSIKAVVQSLDPLPNSKLVKFIARFEWVRSNQDETLYTLKATWPFVLSTVEPKLSFNATSRGYFINGQDVFTIKTD